MGVWGRMQASGRARGWLVAALAIAASADARSQTIFDQTSPSPGPFTSKTFREITGGAFGNPCFSPTYVYSTGVSSGGLVSGGVGYTCESPFPGVSAFETPAVWAPGGAGLDSGTLTPLNVPNFTQTVTGAATGIDAAGKNVVGIILGSNDGVTYNILPYVWTAPSAGAFAGVNPTQLALRPGDSSGGAYGISPSGQYAAGWSGQLQFDIGSVITATSTMHAVLWNVGSNTVTALGATPDPTNSPASSGKAVADNGTVVGWYGKFPPGGFTNDINFNTGSGQLLSYFAPFNFATAWQPKPFVWTMAGATMTQLGMTPLNNSSTTYLYGEARALNPAGNATTSLGTVAVGWLGNSPTTGFEAVRWSTTNSWTTSSTLQLATVQPDDPASTGRLGSVANAVDASGSNVVGRVEYSCVTSSTGFCSQAVYWSVSANGQSSSGATLASILASVGISTSNVTLTDATGIIVVAHSPPENILIVGNGVRNDLAQTQDIFLIQLQRTTTTTTSAALTSVLEQQSSLSSLGVIANQFIALGDSAIMGLANVADYERCRRPKGADAEGIWCGFTYGLVRGNAGYGSSGDDYAGNFGIARYFSAATSVGISVGAAGLNNGLAYQGSFSAPGATFGGYFSHRPDVGLQFLAVAVASLYPDLSVTRGYPNGAAAVASSQGSSRSWTDGAMARIGWSLPVLTPRTIATPFAQLSYIESHVSGWTETGGAFPAMIGAFSGSTTILRLGTQLRTALSDTVTLLGSAAWADALRSNLPVVQGSLLVADCSGAAPIQAFCGIRGIGPGMPTQWAEASAGLRLELSPVSVATISGNLASLNGVTYGTQIGYSHVF